MNATMKSSILLSNTLKLLAIGILLLTGQPLLAQDWPEVAQSANRPCYLIGNWRGIALKNTEVQVYIGKPGDQQTYTGFLNADGTNLWTTDGHGVLCLGRPPAVPQGQSLLVVLDDLLGGLLHPSIPVILLNEDFDVDVALSDSKADDLLSAQTGGCLPVRLRVAERLLAQGPVTVRLASPHLLISETIDAAGQMVAPQQTLEIEVTEAQPVIVYIKPASTEYAFDAEGHFTASLEAEVYAQDNEGLTNGRKANVYATNQAAPVATVNETVTIAENYVLYRGVNVGAGPWYEAAASGLVVPKSWGQPGAHASTVRHNSTGTNESIFTSWTLSYMVAAKFAVAPYEDDPGIDRTATRGVILTKEVPAELLMKSPNSFVPEQEVLQIGPMTTEAVTHVQLDDFERHPAEVMKESAQPPNLERIQNTMAALPQGMRWHTLPQQQSTCYFVAEQWGELLPYATIQAWQVAANGTETALLNNGQNNWPVNKHGYVCFNTGSLPATSTIKIAYLQNNAVFNGTATHNYPIAFIENNPQYIHAVHFMPASAGKEFRTIKGIKPILFGAKAAHSPRDASGNDLGTPFMRKNEIMAQVAEVRLMLDGTQLPINGNIPEDDFDYVANPYQQNEFFSRWTPPGYGTYTFTPELTLNNGTVVKDPMPLKVVVVPLPNQAGLTGGIGVVGLSGGSSVRSTSQPSLHLAMTTQPAQFRFDTARHLNTGAGLAAHEGTISIPLAQLSSKGTVVATGSNPNQSTFEVPFQYAYGTNGQGTLLTPSQQALEVGQLIAPTALVSYNYAVINTGLPAQAQRISHVLSCQTQSASVQGTLRFTYTDTLSQAELNALQAYRWHETTNTWQPLAQTLAVNTSRFQIGLPVTQGGTYALFTEAPPRNTSLLVALSAQQSQSNANALLLVAQQAQSNLTPHYVQFYANGLLVGTDYAAPFELEWLPPAPGQYTLEALPWHSQQPGVPSQLTYAYNVGPDPCPDVHTLTSFSSGTTYSSAQQTVVQGITVAAAQNLILQSAGSVVLQPGFKATTGSFVRALLATCNGQPLRAASSSQQPLALQGIATQAEGADLLTNVYPNPYHDAIEVAYNAAAPGLVQAQLYSLQGTLLATVARRTLTAPGTGSLKIDLSQYNSQLMVLVVRQGHAVQTHKIIKAR